MNSIILLWVISFYLKSCDINYIRYLTRTCRLFADEHSLSFSLKNQKKMSSVGVFGKKKSKCFCEKKSKCPKENFQSVKRGKMFKYRISGVRKKKWKKEKKKFWGEDVWVEFFLLSSCSLVRLYVNLQVKVTEKKNGNFQSILRVGVCALHTLGRHVVKHG